MLNAPSDLDEIDKQIIRALQSDGRLAYSQLGTLVGLSEAAARQRVHRLTDRGVMQIVAVTDPTKIGLRVQAMIGITVEGDIDVVAESLSTVEAFDYVVIAAGRYDILVELVCATTDDLLSVVNTHIRSVAGVRTCEILSYLRLVKQTYNWGTG
jgi:Lrp/AsnC family transcriptional regulator, regulator for asnA, asnC and gidA